MVGQPDEPQRVAELRVGREVSQPDAGQRKRLAHRAADREPLAARQQGQGAGSARAGELGVRLVDDDDPVGGVVDGLDDLERAKEWAAG